VCGGVGVVLTSSLAYGAGSLSDSFPGRSNISPVSSGPSAT
jgi:hypothetical protein